METKEQEMIDKILTVVYQERNKRNRLAVKDALSDEELKIPMSKATAICDLLGIERRWNRSEIVKVLEEYST